MKTPLLATSLLAAATAFGAPAKGSAPTEFHLPPVFSDHMVLQQGAVIPVWGVGPKKLLTPFRH